MTGSDGTIEGNILLGGFLPFILFSFIFWFVLSPICRKIRNNIIRTSKFYHYIVDLIALLLSFSPLLFLFSVQDDFARPLKDSLSFVSQLLFYYITSTLSICWFFFRIWKVFSRMYDDEELDKKVIAFQQAGSKLIGRVILVFFFFIAIKILAAIFFGIDMSKLF